MMAGEASEEKSRNYLASSSGFCYPDVNSNSHFANQMHSFDPNSEIFNLTTGMEMMGFPSKSTQAQQNVSKHGNSPGTSSIKPVSLSSFYQHDDHHHHNQFNRPDFATGFSFSQTNSENLVDDSSLRCVFSCEGRERPSQGLSLSLSSTNPGFQHFELKPISAATTTHHHHDDLRYLTSGSRDGFFGEKPVEIEQNEVVVSEDDYMGKSCNFHLSPSEFHLRNSKFLRAAQELLNDFCCLGTKETGDPPKLKPQREHVNGSGSSSSSRKQQPLYSFDPIELQRRKAKLLSMLEELDRRYRHYCDQMTAVAASFEAVAGNGAAGVYTGMASKAMSRHFRCLRDGIVGQILSIKKAMGEKDPLGGPGTTRGETPRLRVLDQTLRQQKALQQMSMLESHPWRPQRGLPERSVSILRAWLFEHFLHPYPSDVDKHILARQTGLSRSQVSNWFINARVRLWKPMVEEMYLEEIKDQENNNMASSSSEHYQNPNSGAEDEKPTQGRFDPECLSSIISINDPDKNHFIKNPNKTLHQNHQQEAYGGAVELNFPSYHQPMADYTNDGGHQRFGGGGGVSLTLGLQQHAGNGGVSLAFSPACASQSSLFYPRDEIGDCNPVQYSMLADEEGQNRPYRNLLGAQLLHDLAG